MCIYCFISDPYPVYLMEAKAQRPNSLKVKAKRGGRGRGVHSNVYHILTDTHTHTLHQPWGAMVTLEL